ncbi:MAG: sugar phosphate isomerase/epimerase [Anaerolineales bacterium]|nr:sugar phosphate isomerase/epimerase [Anaerolineales bacterium]
MKTGLVMCGPDVAYGPLALLTGTFEEKAQKAHALGFDGIELMVRDPAGLDWEYVKRILQTNQLETPQVVTGELFGADGLCLVTPDDELYRLALARTQAVIDLAAYLDHAMVNVGRLRGRLDWMRNVTDPWAVAVERIRDVTRYAGARGVVITLEPINRYEVDFIANVQDGLCFLQDVGEPNLGLMLDLFHMNIEDASIKDSLAAAGKHCRHVHIADTNRLYPGAGHMDFDAVFDTLRATHYQGYVSAEILPKPDPDTAAARTIEFLRKHLS